ncbi:MAG: hypothetical protein Q4G27_05460 [Flavobacteriaceae bacterium]|nr:hypothetical protein [Flavobacteriaceae bacterium]
MKKLKLKNFKETEIKKSQLVSIKGGTSTTLVKQVGFADLTTYTEVAENEYEDSNGNGEFDKGDRFLGTFNMPI